MLESAEIPLRYLPHAHIEITTIEALAEYLADYLNEAQIAHVRSAYLLAADAHKTQFRKTGEPYITHPLAVAVIAAQLRMDCASICAALMHDVIEDSHYTHEDLANQFGEEIASLVSALTKLDHINFESKAIAKAENFQRMAMAMARDIRVIIIKMCDRLHNMVTLGIMRPDKKRRISRETLDIYVPIAERLGMNNFKLEFEELCFQFIYPKRQRTLGLVADSVRAKRKEDISTVRDNIAQRLAQEGIKGTVVTREKHLYGIYEKFKDKGALSELSDVFNCRVIVENVDNCYRALGILHSMFKPMPDQFNDYIAIPKQNGYQSLHTVLFGAHGTPIHAQIRTYNMDLIADYGIAAHWLYDKSELSLANPASDRVHRWMQSLLEMQQHVGNSLEFLEHVKEDLFPDEVYVFTPNGEIIELPRNATAIDFAYKLHTDVGNTSVGCRIDGSMAPLTQRLSSGQTIEIITNKDAKPQPSWLDHVVIGRARVAIQHFLRNQAPSGALVENGRNALEKALRSLGSSLANFRSDAVDTYAKNNDYKGFDDLCSAIGTGNSTAFLTARAMLSSEGFGVSIDRSLLREALTIRGDEGASLNFGKCCKPIPGDEIVGRVNANRGIVAHRQNCYFVSEQAAKGAELLPLHWDDHTLREFQVDLRVSADNLRGIVPKVASVISANHSDIEHITTTEQASSKIVIDLTLDVQNRQHLATIMRRTRRITGVDKVIRVQQKSSRKNDDTPSHSH